ncbi:hypothetical protein PFISCL1PPCAC_25898, partial [Pristionchus fissidentatus]
RRTAHVITPLPLASSSSPPPLFPFSPSSSYPPPLSSSSLSCFFSTGSCRTSIPCPRFHRRPASSECPSSCPTPPAPSSSPPHTPYLYLPHSSPPPAPAPRRS